jgi:cytochrome c biogenesis protein CcdA/glutaredoxin
MNKKFMFMLFIVLILSIFSLGLVIAKENSNQDNNVNLHFFYGKGCPHCAKAMVFLNYLEDKYPEINIFRHETYFDEKGRTLFIEMSNKLSKNIECVPTFFIDDKSFVGFSNFVAEEIEKEIKKCINLTCNKSIIKKNNALDIEFKQSITIPAVIFAALVDAINPCAFAVLIILLTTILVSKNKNKALFSGFAFTSSIFISYFLMGIGLYSAIQASGLIHIFYIIVAILALIIGLFNLKDYFWYGKWFIMEVPMSWRPKLKSLINSVTSIPGAFGIGFLVSLFLLPCTSGPYIVILGLLSKIATKNYAIALLFLYNLIFILPMILITLAVYFGLTTTKKAEEFRQKKLKVLHLIAGIILLCLGIGMLIALYLGIV